MLLDKKIKIKWNKNNIKYFKLKGYTYTKIGNEFEVNINDLNISNKIEVNIKCDYCGKVFKQNYNLHTKGLKSNIKKDCCSECISLKRKEAFMEKYGVEHVLQNKQIQNKVKQTNLEKYGVENAFQNKEIQLKMKNTMLEKYGVEHNMQLKETKIKIKNTNLEKYGTEFPMQNKQIKNKVKQTNLEKYGVECVLQSKYVRDKVRQNNLEKYGTEYVTQNKNEMEKILCKINKTMYENGNTISSKQQRYICNLLNGKLNYPIGHCFFDIAFLEEMIYIEYDGSGHDLRIKFGMSEKEFKQKEIRRKSYLESLGWKLIRIKSNKDLLPDDVCILKLINDAKIYLNKNHTWYEINLDEKYILNSENKLLIKIENLRKIKEDI